MGKYEKVIQAAIIAAGLLMLGLCIKGGFDNFTNKDRRVTVKGLAERTVDADKVTWNMRVSQSGDDLNALFVSLNAKIEVIRQYLKENGIEGKATVTVNSFSIVDNNENIWNNHVPRYRYTVSRGLSITSSNTLFIHELCAKKDDALIARGIILDSDYANYEYTKFQQLKPEMMSEAIAAAEKTAQQFAENSHSTINKIVAAGQGEFAIDDADIAYQKKVRVVSTITYSLKD